MELRLRVKVSGLDRPSATWWIRLVSEEEKTSPTRLALQQVLFILGSPGKEKRYRGEAYVSPDHIYIESIDAAGKKWIDDWWTLGFYSGQEIRIRSKKTNLQDAQILFEGFVAFTYRNPRDVPDKGLRTIERFVAVLRVQHPFRGSPLHRNWKEINSDGKYWYIEEWLLCSDVNFVGQIDSLGPYSIINGLPEAAPVMRSLILRAYIHPVFPARRWIYV